MIAARGVDKIDPLLARLTNDESLPALARSLFAHLGAEFAQTQGRLKQVSAALMAWHRHNELSQRLTQIPGVGPIGATLLVLCCCALRRKNPGRILLSKHECPTHRYDADRPFPSPSRR